MTTRYNTLLHYIPPNTDPKVSDFGVNTIPKPSLTGSSVLVQTLYTSVDPYMRFYCLPELSKYGQFEVGKPTYGSGVGRVIESMNNEFKVGDVLFTWGELDWPSQEIVMLEGDKLMDKKKLNVELEPKLYSALTGTIGITGLTAYFGLLKVGNPKEGNTICISGACGAVGNVVGQLAKDLGLKVIGITSNEKKGDHLRDVGFDNVITYTNKSKKDMIQELNQICPEGIDIYYDNVGGVISESVVEVMKPNSKYILCGRISRYNKESEQNMFNPEESQTMKEKNIHHEFFGVLNHKNEFDEGWNYLLKKVKEGKLKIKETIYDGIEKWPNAFVGLFECDNIGKSVVRISE